MRNTLTGMEHMTQGEKTMRNTHTNLIGCTLAVLLLAATTAMAETPLGSG